MWERLLGVVGVLGMGQWERESNDGSATPEGTTASLRSWRWEEGVRGRGRLSGRCKRERGAGSGHRRGQEGFIWARLWCTVDSAHGRARVSS